MNFRKYVILFLPLLLYSASCSKNEPVPVSDFVYSGNNNFKAPCTVQFTNLSTQAFSYGWWFGSDSSATTLDAPGSELTNPMHVYTKPGSFSVILRSYTESRKEWSSIIKTIIIKDSI
ncbi:MAG: PKD domain-containing protein [Bacteroidota bacterium]